MGPGKHRRHLTGVHDLSCEYLDTVLTVLVLSPLWYSECQFR